MQYYTHENCTVIITTNCDQAINNLAVTDDNKLKILKAGALPHYVKLLGRTRHETEQQAAARGLWILAFKCKVDVIKEPGCVDGCQFINY